MLIYDQNLTDNTGSKDSSSGTPAYLTSPLCGGYMSSIEVWTDAATIGGSSQRIPASAMARPF